MSTQDANKYGWGIALIQYEIQRLWTIYGIFLLAETVLISGVGLLLGDGKYNIALGGAIIGFLLVLPWWATFEYTRYFYLLRVMQIKELEPNIASFLKEGHNLANGDQIKGIKISKIIRFFRPQRAAWFLMITFVISFLLIIAITI